MTSPQPNRRWYDGAMETVTRSLSQRSLTGIDSATEGNQKPPTPPPSSIGSLDIPFLNRSSHGKKESLAETVKNLSEENQRLTETAAKLEDDYMSQIDNSTQSFREQKTLLNEQLDMKEKQIAELLEKCQSMETLLREKDEGMKQLEDEASSYRLTVADLEQQIYLANGQAHDDQRQELIEKYESLREENSRLRGLGLREEKKESSGSDDTAQIPEESNEVIGLREQCLGYSTQVTELNSKLAVLQADADNRDRSRDIEVRDLRLMNASQQQEIESLREQLEQVQHSLSVQKESYEKAVLSLQSELQSTKAESSKQVAELMRNIEGLEKENLALKKPKSAFEEDDNEELMIKVETIEREKRMLEEDYLRKITKLKHAHKLAITELQEELDVKDDELRKFRRRTSAGESTEDSRISEMKAEIQKLRNDLASAKGVSVGEYDSRHSNVRQTHEQLRVEFSIEKQNAEKQISELTAKLEERDATISSIIKSSDALREQGLSQKVELDSLRALNAKNREADLHSVSETEVARLKRELEAKDKIEEALTSQFQQLRKQAQSSYEELAHLRTMLERITSEKNRLERSLDEACVNPNKVAAEHTRRQLQERDDAISNLVKQSLALEKTIRELRDELSFTKKQLVSIENSRENSLSSEEVNQLRREAEVFAGQVIELDEEIETLKKALDNKNGEIADLKKVIQTLEASSNARSSSASSKEVVHLQAELDELKEANEVQLEEIRLLRRKAREFESHADEVAEAQHETARIRHKAEQLRESVVTLSKEKDEVLLELGNLKEKYEQDLASMTEKLEAAKTLQGKSITELEDELISKDKALVELKMRNIDEIELEGLREELSTLRRNFANQSAALESAGSTIRELESMMANRSSKETVRYEEEKEELLAEIESLQEQLENTQRELQRVEDQRIIIDDFKAKLENADEAREASEKSIIDTYERKLSLLKLDKDVTIDKLRNELMAEKEGNTEELKEFQERMQEYENEISELKEDLRAQVEQRESRIFDLESTLEAQEQLLKNMRIEMDHLQSSMDVTTENRRKQADDMQQDLVAVTSKNAKLEREIDSLKSQIDADRLKHESEVTLLQDKIASMESTSHDSHQDASDLKMEARLQAVKDRLEKLSWRNTSLKEENMALRDRLLKAEANIQTGEQEEISTLKLKIEEQSLRIKELESRGTKPRTPSRTRAMFAPPPPPPPPARSMERRPSNRLGGLLGLGKRSSSVPRGTANA